MDNLRLFLSPAEFIDSDHPAVHAEATARGYAFDRRKIGPRRRVAPIAATSGQVAYEWRHLMKKLSVRNRPLHRHWKSARRPDCHPLFRRVRGPVAEWERP